MSSLDIKTVGDKPRRVVFSHIARRIGDKPATRYQEATYDLQSTTNFHYRPAQDARYELFDVRKTRVVMSDWYDLLDPRQYYYGTYTQARGKLSEGFEKSLAYAEKSGSLRQIEVEALSLLRFYLLPLRHVEWGANMNNCLITSEGYGTAITQATMYATMDRLGLAQMISRIGLALDGSSGESLLAAKTSWLEDERWQPMRKLVEDTLVVEDWYELLLAQDLAMDGIIYPLFFGAFEDGAGRRGTAALSYLTESFREWFADTSRWIDAVIKKTTAESSANRALLSQWYTRWRDRAIDACRPIAQEVLQHEADRALASVLASLNHRAAANGLSV